MKANSGAVLGGEVLARASPCPAYWAPVSRTCRARFQVQRASSDEPRGERTRARSPPAARRRDAAPGDAAARRRCPAPRGDTTSSSGSGRSCTSAPPATALIDVPLQRSNASHSRARSPASSNAPIGFATMPRTRDRLRQRAADREPDADDAPDPRRILSQHQRQQPARRDGHRNRVDAFRRVVGAPEEVHFGGLRQVVRRPGDHRIVGRAQAGDGGDDRGACGVDRGDDQLVVDAAADAPDSARSRTPRPLVPRTGTSALAPSIANAARQAAKAIAANHSARPGGKSRTTTAGVPAAARAAPAGRRARAALVGVAALQDVPKGQARIRRSNQIDQLSM